MMYVSTVHVVDDDESVRNTIVELLGMVGIRAVAYASASDFLASYDPSQPGCLVLDLRLPGMDGMELQQRLLEKRISVPIVFLSGYGEMPVAVQAMKRGAVDFIAKPFNQQALLDSIKAAINRDQRDRASREAHSIAEARLSSLTPRERDVLALLIRGKSNKAIAAELGLSHKTVEFHRSRIMTKSRADSLADLVRMSMLAAPEWETAGAGA
jgi:FixJ family two-component response regulator